MGKSTRVKCRAICVGLFVFFSCQESNQDTIKIYSIDPYESSFWGKNINYMVSYMGATIIDTVHFDSHGNRIQISSFGHVRLRQEWDNLHRLFRQAEFGEFPAYYTYSYDTAKEKYTAEMHLMSSVDWDGKLDSLYERKVYRIVYQLDGLGKIIERIDTTLDDTITKLAYKDNKIVEKIDSLLLGDDSYVKRWTYFYNEATLARIDFYWNGDLYTVDYFDERGLIKYSISNGKPGQRIDTIRYRFVYK